MKSNLPIIVIFVILISSPGVIEGQENQEGVQLRNVQIPALNVLIDSAAINSPLIRISELQTRVIESDVKSVKREWLRNIGIESSYHYGMFGSLSTTENPTASVVNNSLAYAKQNTYSTGVYLRIPISEAADRRNKARAGKFKIDQSIQEQEKIKSELKERIIVEYNRALLAIELLKIRSESLESANLQIALGDKQFRNGNLSLVELASLKERQTKAAAEFITTLSDAKSELMLLEEICGIKIIK